MIYSIREVAEKLKVTPNTLRYYEKVHVLDHIGRDKNGVRQYSDHDVERAQMAVIFRGMGMPIKEVRNATHEIGDNPTLEELYTFKEHISSLLDELAAQERQIKVQRQAVKEKIRIVNNRIKHKMADTKITTELKDSSKTR